MTTEDELRAEIERLRLAEKGLDGEAWDLAQDFTDLAGRYEDIREKARAFLARYDALEPAVTGAFAFMQVHGAPYAGGNWKDEMDALRGAVTALDIAPGVPIPAVRAGKRGVL